MAAFLLVILAAAVTFDLMLGGAWQASLRADMARLPMAPHPYSIAEDCDHGAHEHREGNAEENFPANP